MRGLPSLVCPKCKGALEYHATIEMLDPPVGRIDTAYCPACRRLFECVRDTRTFYDSTRWPPLCRVCRQPVAFVSLWAGPDEEAESELLRYECREHPQEQWMLTRGTDHWSRVD